MTAARGAPFLAACVQMRSGVARGANVETALGLIDEAAGLGATVILTPEMTTALDREPGRLAASLPVGEDLPEVAAFARMAKARKVWLTIGSMPIKRADGRLANRCFVFAPSGVIAARYDKIHMFDVALANGETWRESATYVPGAHAVVVAAMDRKIGLTICYDLRFPALYRRLAQAGATGICVPAAFTRQTGEAHWRTLLTARAIECGAFILAAAQGGRHEDGRETFGHSTIIGPWGEILGELDHDAPGVLLAEVDAGRAHDARRRIPCLDLEQSFEILKLGE